MDSKYCIEKTALIKSQPEHIFRVLTDLNHWNQWTPSIIGISFVGKDTFAVGTRIKVLQPKLPPAVWTITEISENKLLVWKKKSFALKVTANHIIQDSHDGAIVKLQIIHQGFLANLAYKLSSTLTDKYLTMEITGLKERCERYKS
jgi:hypothetical protein